MSQWRKIMSQIRNIGIFATCAWQYADTRYTTYRTYFGKVGQAWRGLGCLITRR